jgi:hypothetical protein
MIDGELGEAERRELLARLDATPGGWRRCALGFLESQSLAVGLERFRRRAERRAERRDRRLQRREARRQRRRVLFGSHPGTILAMAASFLGALVLGMLIRGAWDGPDRPSLEPDQIAAEESPAAAPPASPGSQAAPPVEKVPLAAPAEEPWQYVAIPVSAPDGTSDSVRIPVTQRETIDETWLESLPEAVPTDVVRSLIESGHEVRQQRRLMPLWMRDGRRLVVPYDQVEIHYTGRNAYQ